MAKLWRMGWLLQLWLVHMNFTGASHFVTDGGKSFGGRGWAFRDKHKGVDDFTWGVFSFISWLWWGLWLFQCRGGKNSVALGRRSNMHVACRYNSALVPPGFSSHTCYKTSTTWLGIGVNSNSDYVYTTYLQLYKSLLKFQNLYPHVNQFPHWLEHLKNHACHTIT